MFFEYFDNRNSFAQQEEQFFRHQQEEQFFRHGNFCISFGDSSIV